MLLRVESLLTHIFISTASYIFGYGGLRTDGITKVWRIMLNTNFISTTHFKYAMLDKFTQLL